MTIELFEVYDKVMDTCKNNSCKPIKEFMKTREFEKDVVMEKVEFGTKIIFEGEPLETYLKKMGSKEHESKIDESKVDAIFEEIKKRRSPQNGEACGTSDGMEDADAEFAMLFIISTYLRRNYKHELAFDLNKRICDDRYNNHKIRNVLSVKNWFYFVKSEDHLERLLNEKRTDMDQQAAVADALSILSGKIRSKKIAGTCSDPEINKNGAAQNDVCELVCNLVEKKMLEENDESYADCINAAHSGISFAIALERYSTFVANRGKISLIISKSRNKSEKEIAEKREQAKRDFEWAIGNDSIAVDQTSRKMKWKDCINDIKAEETAEKFGKMLADAEADIERISRDEMQRVVLIVTFLAGFLALLVYSFGLFDTSSTEGSWRSLLMASGCLILILSSFRIIMERRHDKRSFRNLFAASALLMGVSLAVILIAIFAFR